MLSKFILDDARGKLSDGDIIASFFFHPDEPKLRSRRTMLQGLLHDILRQNRQLYPYFQSQFRDFKKRIKEQQEPCNSGWQEDELDGILRILSGHKMALKVYLLIDGLDDSQELKDCAETLAGLAPRRGIEICFKLLVSTQPSTAAETLASSFSNQRTYELNLEMQNEQDISEYTKSFLNASVVRNLNWNCQDIESTCQKVIKKSEDRFLRAKLAGGLIMSYSKATGGASLADFNHFLETMPEEIDEIYSRLLERLVDRLQKGKKRADGVSRIRKVFQIATQARRPLLVEEFQGVYCVTAGPGNKQSGNLRQRKTGNMADVITQYTANFLEIHSTGSGQWLRKSHNLHHI